MIGYRRERPLNHVRKRSVSNIMQQCSCLDKLRVTPKKLHHIGILCIPPFKHCQNPLSEVKYAQAMSEPSVDRPWIGQTAHA